MNKSTIEKLKNVVKLEFGTLRYELYQKPKDYIFSESRKIEFYKTWFSLITQDNGYIDDMLELNGIDEGSLVKELEKGNFLAIQYVFMANLIEPIVMDYDGILSSLETYFNYH